MQCAVEYCIFEQKQQLVFQEFCICILKMCILSIVYILHTANIVVVCQYAIPNKAVICYFTHSSIYRGKCCSITHTEADVHMHAHTAQFSLPVQQMPTKQGIRKRYDYVKGLNTSHRPISCVFKEQIGQKNSLRVLWHFKVQAEEVKNMYLILSIDKQDDISFAGN